jgi:hypothetical protein
MSCFTSQLSPVPQSWALHNAMQSDRVCMCGGLRGHVRSEGVGVVQLAVQPGLQVSDGESVLAAAVVGPLTGNSCPGDGSTPFVGCPAGLYCPTPAQKLLCPVVSKLHCNSSSLQLSEVLYQTIGLLIMSLHSAGLPQLLPVSTRSALNRLLCYLAWQQNRPRPEVGNHKGVIYGAGIILPYGLSPPAQVPSIGSMPSGLSSAWLQCRGVPHDRSGHSGIPGGLPDHSPLVLQKSRPQVAGKVCSETGGHISAPSPQPEACSMPGWSSYHVRCPEVITQSSQASHAGSHKSPIAGYLPSSRCP